MNRIFAVTLLPIVQAITAFAALIDNGAGLICDDDHDILRIAASNCLR
jgi:hypothetical protein